MNRSFFEHAEAFGLPQEERDRIIRERNWTGEEQMTISEFEAVVAPAEDPPPAEESGPAQDGAEELRAEREILERENEGLRAERDALRRENEELKAELAAAKKPRRGAKKPEGAE